jgi:HlyD family secretion protein
VTVASVTRADVIAQVPISGTLVARDEVLVYPNTAGFTIQKLHFDIGDRVKAGDVLAELNAQTLTAQLASAEAELTRAQANVRQAQSQINSAMAALTQANTVLDRAQSLRTSGTGTQAALDQATTNAQSAQASVEAAQDGLAVAQAAEQIAAAQLDIAKLNLSYATITAPVDGLISTRNGQVGAIASTGGEPIFKLIEQGVIEVEAEVVETAISDITSGDRVALNVAGIGPVTGNVRLVSPTVDPVTRLGRLRISMGNTDRLRAGLFASGNVITQERNALTVPSTAVLNDSLGPYVLTVDTEGLVARQEVVPGIIWQGRREIISGLTLDETVIARAGAFFAEGDVVNPVAKTTTAETAETAETEAAQ